MSVTPFYTARSALQDIFLERLRLGGFPEAADLPIAADLNVTQNGQVHSNVFFSSIIFLAYALNIGTFDLAVRTRAVKVLTQNGKAVGVKVISPDMKTYSLTANTIVVSAGPWETPRLLLASGIPGEAIGRYLVHHSQYSADAFVYREQFPEVLGVAMLYVPGSAEREYQLVAFTEFFYKYMEIPLRQTVKINLRGYGVVEPRRENGVSLDISQKDAFGVPLLNVQFSHSDKDRAILRQISATLLALSAAMKLTMETAPQLEPPGIDNHEAGTCRMGNDPFTSATNRFGQIHGVTGLYIADNSVLNMTSPANPTLTTIALAMRTADHIVEQLK
jgi:gluconate 5-dehydrogenase